jgi:hypothetical protein
MPRGGKRVGAGRKPQLLRYDGQSVDPLALKAGQQCEVRWRKSYKTNFVGFHDIGDKRPRTRKSIILEVAKEFGLMPPMVESLWKDYRRVEVQMNSRAPAANNAVIKGRKLT